MMGSAPTPAVVDRTIVPPVQINPRESRHPPPTCQLRTWIRQDPSEGVARAMGERQLERACRRCYQNVTVLVPAPAWIGGKPKRLAARYRAFGVGEREPDLQRSEQLRAPCGAPVAGRPLAAHSRLDAPALHAGPPSASAPLP